MPAEAGTHDALRLPLSHTWVPAFMSKTRLWHDAGMTLNTCFRQATKATKHYFASSTCVTSDSFLKPAFFNSDMTRAT